MEKVAESVDGQAKFAKVNVDDAGSVAGRFGVQAIPTLLLFKNGNGVRHFVVVQPREILIDAINSAV